MDILCSGTDPAGLYLAILLKQGDASHRVTILDRGAAAAEPGAFIDNPVKGPLRLTDAAVAKAIAASTVRMDGVRVRLDGEETATSGQSYSTIAVERLTAILKRRAQALGCIWQAGEAEAGATDLLICAEGADSPLRARHAERLQPSLTEGESATMLCEGKGDSDKVSFCFRRTPDGLVHAMIYPAARGRLSVVIEAPAEAAQALDIAALRTLFADEPGAASWKPRTGWRPFATVRTRSWHAGPMVLLGRAAYSAHPSVGLDVRQGLEDAEALAGLILQGLPIEQALEQFEKSRRPLADSLQRAASASESWLAHAGLQAARLPFDQFAVACLTRSLRLTHTHLKSFAPDLVRRTDRLVSPLPETANAVPPPPMFSAFELRGLTLANRIVVSPMCMYSAVEGMVNDFHLVHLGSRAQGGAGLVFTEMTDISPEGRISLNCAGMYAPEHVPAWKRVTDFVHRHSDAKIGVQLAHAGRKAALTPVSGDHHPIADEGWELLSPSPIPFAEGRKAPREMSLADIARIRDAFAEGARMSEAAGFDIIELHMAHGYLLSSFISPLSNRRTDRYGGSLANRLRFPLEVLEAVRAAWPDAKPISVRISAIDWVEGGTTIEEAIEISRALHQAGADVIDVSTGAVTNHRRPTVGRLYQLGFSDRIRNALGIPTMAVGAIASWSDANSIVAAGRADLCLMARGALIDPYFVRHAAHAQGYDMPWPKPYGRAAELDLHDG